MTMTSLLLAVVLLALPPVARAGDGGDGATIRGRVTDDQGRPLAHVEVIAQATTLPGRVTTQSVATGHYMLRALPDGEYVFTFQRETLVVHKVMVVVAPGELVSLDVVLVRSSAASGKPEPIVVTIQDQQAFIRHPLVAVTYRRDRIEMLPILGSAASALELGPGTITTSVFQPGVWLDDRPVTLASPDRRGALPIDFGRASLAEITAMRAGVPIDLGPADGGAIQIAPRRGGGRPFTAPPAARCGSVEWLGAARRRRRRRAGGLLYRRPRSRESAGHRGSYVWRAHRPRPDLVLHLVPDGADELRRTDGAHRRAVRERPASRHALRPRHPSVRTSPSH
jgi:hypothetical protein